MQDKVLVCKKPPRFLFGTKALIINNTTTEKSDFPQFPVFISNSISQLNEGDVVGINPEGYCNILWEANSHHNALFVTDACNSKCIMCPQPMQEHPNNYFSEIQQILELIDYDKTSIISITGGEPTLHIKQLASILQFIKNKKPKVAIHILTNARKFTDISNLEIINSVQKSNITYGIPLYSDLSEEHDFIVGIDGAFNDTILALYNLAQTKQMVEVRIVVLKQNYHKLANIIDFIYRNLPFVTHIAIMALEYIGTAKNNYDIIHIDPLEYRENLFKAIRQSRRYAIATSVYNVPLCLLDKRIWEYARDSISTWKKGYIEECKDCLEQNNCCGIFETSFVHSNNLKKFTRATS